MKHCVLGFLISIFLNICLLNNVSAEIIGTWQCGDNCMATLDDNGLFYVSGTGSTYNYEHYSQPWKNYLSNITSVEIQGISTIGTNLTYYSPITSLKLGDSITNIAGGFEGSLIEQVELPDSVKSIGNWAFSSLTNSEIIIPDTISAIYHDAFGKPSDMQNIKIVCRGNNCANVANMLEHYVYYGSVGTIETDISGKLFLADETNCDTKNYYWNGYECLKEPVVDNRVCLGGYVKRKDKCIDPLKTFAKKYWTPAEANQWLYDEDNTIIMTFKVNR